ncbi:hypothetical protein K492DRAFT_171458 [Lichtheimia hyalospora FSU 10163]|nr:hypothetical protein K492DRAFT_171458 [Lichtheimia hyalospora FSU 10163]
MRSNVLYCPHNRAKAKTLPPVLIKIQYTTNGALFRHPNEYALMIRKHQPLSPVVIIFGIHNSTEEFKDLTYECVTMPFAKELYYRGWAQKCYFISCETISTHMDQQPLYPLAAIGHFLIERQTSILNITKKRIQQSNCYTRSPNEAIEEDARQDAIITICTKAKLQFNQATLLLEEDVPDSQARKRTIDCLADGLQLINCLHRIYTTISSPASSSTTPTTTPNHHQHNTTTNRATWTPTSAYIQIR